MGSGFSVTLDKRKCPAAVDRNIWLDMMKSFLLLAVLVVASLATAIVTPQPKGRKGFTLEATKNTNSKPDFVREWVAARLKWGAPVSAEVLSAFSLLDEVDGTHANGVVYLDTLRLGALELKNTAIQSAQIVAPRFERETELTGIMGLAKSLPSNIDPPTPSLLDKLRPLLDEPVFTVDLRRNATGRFDFGQIDETRTKDNISWMATREDSPHWDVTFDMTAWTGQRRVWMAHTFEATVDTGTTLLYLPGELAGLYWYDVPEMKIDPRLGDAFTFPCKFANQLPDLMLKVPGTEHVLKIPGPYLSYSPTDNDPDYCWGGLQSAESLGVTILGDVALKALYVAFDLEKKKVGFANKELDDIDG
ncbi:aspartic peptidase domain-containing protein [Fusarium acuminatum]|uniref:Aspartic peptidase domain-containing protein n=1 Tax=Fusarium acuminatum TaxID=5515 RepID=A0ABZ2WQ08_9HYPO